MKNGLFLSVLLLIAPASLLAQAAAFTYQGRPVDGGQPANGNYDLQFRLADSASSGNYVGVTVTNTAGTDSNGLFSVTLDYGASVFDGSPRWLEIGVRTNGSVGPYTLLSPRQAINKTPYAAFANAAASAALATSITPGALAGTGGLTNGSTAANLTLMNPTFATAFDASKATNFNATVDSLPRTFGSEYLYHWFSLLRSNLPVKVVFDGDSTSAGNSIADWRYLLQNLIPALIGPTASTITWASIAVSGVDVVYWNTNAVAAELAQNPDLLIVRFGINGPNVGSVPRADLEPNFRAALSTLRAARNLDQMSIVVMAPNSTAYEAAGHNAAYHQALQPIIRRAARDYLCAFVDTYSFLKDSTNQATLWMDSYLTHPRDEMNLQIGGLLADFILPTSIRQFVASKNPAALPTSPSTRLANFSAYDDHLYAGTTNGPAPLHFTNYISSHWVWASDGFPFSGALTTIRQYDYTYLQINTPYLTNSAGMAMRVAYVGQGNNTWSPWAYLLTTDTRGNAVAASGLKTTNTPSAGQVLKYDGTNMYWSN